MTGKNLFPFLLPSLLPRWLSRFVRDRRGVAAVEFALLLPVIITLYFGGIEVADLLIIDRKVTNASNTVADLVTQMTVVNNNSMQDIFNATQAILTPYPGAALQVTVTSVVADLANNTTVAWSDGFNAAPRAVGSTIVLPAGLTTPGSSVIVSEVSYSYTNAIGQFLGTITMTDESYLRPRRSLQIIRTP